MMNCISHRLQPYRGTVNFILAQLYTGVNRISREGGWVRRRWLFWDVLVSHLHEQVPVPSDGILPKCLWSLRLFSALAQHPSTHLPTILRLAPCNKTSYPQDDAASAKSRYEASPSEQSR